ncbi:MAG: LPS assembly protein LptD [Holophagae bacterium]|jgi:LPS-assembly protein
MNRRRPAADRAIVHLVLAVLLTLFAGRLPAADDEERVFLRADTQNATEDTWVGEGGVHIVYQDIEIRCDRAEYNRSTGEVSATGGVVVDRGPSRFTATEARFNLEEKSGVFYGATAFVDPMYSFSGQKIEKLDETRYRLERATFTTCDVDGRSPPWSFRFKKALIEQEGMGRFTSTAMMVRKAPVFYLPYMVWPIKQERAAGLLMPSFGYSDRRGFNLGLPLFVPLGRSYDTTILADYYSENLFGLGTLWRWAPIEGARGEINLYAVYDEPNEEFQWRLFGFHNQDDFLGFRLLAQVENLSDIDFWQDFDRTFDANTRRDLYSFVYLTRYLGPYALNIRADNRQTFLTTNDVVLSQIPEVEVRSGSTPLGRSQVYLNLIGSLNYLDVDRGGELRGQYGRADLFPTLSYTLPGPAWLSVTPRVGGRFTYYTEQLSEDRQSFVDEALGRVYATGGVDIVGPSVSRIFNSGIGGYVKMKHLIEPRFEYRYLTTTTDVSRIPIFDEVDSTPRDANFLRFIFANRLLGKAAEGVGTRELASLELIQDLSFDEPLTQGTDGDSSQLGPLSMALRLTPMMGTGFDARVSYDLFYKSLRSTSLAASIQRPFGNLSMTWYESYNARTGDRFSSQIRGLVGFRRAGFPLDVSVQIAYDIVKEEIGDQRFRIGWQGSCWNISGLYRDTRIGAFPTKEFLIVIGLKGVGALPEIRGSLGGY